MAMERAAAAACPPGPARLHRRRIASPPPVVAMFRKMLQEDRKRAGWSAGQAAWRLGVSVREYRELVAGERWPSFETWDRICGL